VSEIRGAARGMSDAKQTPLIQSLAAGVVIVTTNALSEFRAQRHKYRNPTKKLYYYGM